MNSPRMQLGVLAALGILTLAGCAGGSGPEGPSPEEGQAVARPLEVYETLGLVAGPGQFPAVASFATLAGPADSTYVVFGLSLPNSALRFQRDAGGFLGQYRVRLTFMQDSQEVKRVERIETVRVPSFAETGRTDESVVFQALVALEPGEYEVEVEARDALGSRGFEKTDTLQVPAFGIGGRRVSSPVMVYRAGGRGGPDVAPELIVNPRHTLPYGGEAARLYIEGYGMAEGERVVLRVVDGEGASLWTDSVAFTGGDGLRYAVVDVPPGALPLGRLWVEMLETGGDATPERAPLLVTISDQWMVANFDEVLEIVGLIAGSDEVDSLRSAVGDQRRELWDRFWARRDPLPVTPINEFREQFFERVRMATLQFAENGRPGWKTDRGEVFIVLGPPHQFFERQVGRSDNLTQPNAVEWIYDNGPAGRLDLLFVDRNGFGRYELTPSSDAAFRSAARRLRPS